MPKLLTSDQLASLLGPGMTVFVQSSSSEPTALIEMLEAVPEAAAGVEFVACQIPGLNRVDFARLHPEARFTGLFVTPETAGSYKNGKMRFMPLSYSGMYRYLQSRSIDIAFIQVAPTTKRGIFSFGSSAHFATAAVEGADIVVAEINDQLPLVGRSISIEEGRLDYVLPTDHVLPSLPLPEPSSVTRRIAAHVAELVRDGDHVQIGIGKVPSATIEALSSHRRLCCRGGLITDGMIDLYEAGALDAEKPLVATSVIGTDRIYGWVRHRKDVHVHPVSVTHDIRVLAECRRLVAINSVLAVDLSGQANAETVDGLQAGGCGGLPDFVRGAALSKGGRSILALPATAKQGSISRIVASLADDTTSSLRADADYVVTEHGIAELAHQSVHERAEALIEIAEPSFREALAENWAKRLEGK